MLTLSLLEEYDHMSIHLRSNNSPENISEGNLRTYVQLLTCPDDFGFNFILSDY